METRPSISPSSIPLSIFLQLLCFAIRKYWGRLHNITFPKMYSPGDFFFFILHNKSMVVIHSPIYWWIHVLKWMWNTTFIMFTCSLVARLPETVEPLSIEVGTPPTGFIHAEVIGLLIKLCGLPSDASFHIHFPLRLINSWFMPLFLATS